MASGSIATSSLRALLAGAGLLGLAACQQPKEEYSTDVVDKSGGDLVVEEADPNAVPVDVPDTEMTNVPAEDAPAEEAPAE